MTKEPSEDRSDKEIARLRDEVVKRMLATPPQPRMNSEKKPKLGLKHKP